ncbi:MAG: M20/M25/M40 family metallo-hydrolase [Candidatus Binatia bacterium]
MINSGTSVGGRHGTRLKTAILLACLTALAVSSAPAGLKDDFEDLKQAVEGVAGNDEAGKKKIDEVAESVLTPAEETVLGVAERSVELLQDYIRIKTINPPGKEINGALFLASLLEEEGIEARVLESAPGRGNLYARLRGNGEEPAIILLSHIDVVAADATQWMVPPFDAVVRDGELFGRGALDAKGVGMTQLLATIAIKRLGVPLKRDIILLATADEERGGRLGAKWMVDNHFGLFADAEFLLNEGGFIHRDEGKPLIYKLGVAEKSPCWFRIVASGDPGHASQPGPETAVTRLVDALYKLEHRKRTYEVGPVVAGYYAAYAAIDEEHARQYRQLERSLESQEFFDWFMGDPTAVALVTDTITPTVLTASVKTNVIPAQAVAEVDSRLLPGHDCWSFLSSIRELVGGEHVTIESTGVNFPATQSPMNTALTEAVERVAAVEETKAVVLPAMLAGFTDSHYFRQKGIHSYGMVPMVVTASQRASIHGPDERVSVEELKAAVSRMVKLLQEVGS